MARMLPVAESGEVRLHCPGDGRFAFFSSPYPSHRLMTGLDIYPEAWFGGEAPSPVGGTILDVRRVRAPEGRGFEDAGFDAVIVIQTEAPGRVVKIIHVDPCVEPGQEVEAGESLGLLIRSGYFGFHTSPHLHVEVRPTEDSLRVRGGYPLSCLLKADPGEPLKTLRGTVTWSREEHARIRVEGADGAGLPVEIDGSTGFLDGGVPTYGWMGAHFSEPPRIGSINLLGRKIGRITRVEKRSCIADCEPFRLTLNGVEVGLYTALYPRGGCNVHVAPRVPRALRLREGEEVEILLAGNP